MVKINHLTHKSNEMKKTVAYLFLLLAATNMLFAQNKVDPQNYHQESLIKSFVTYSGSEPLPVMPKLIVDKSIAAISFTGNKSIKIKKTKRYEKFNPKKDDISDVVIRRSSMEDAVHYEIVVLHKNRKLCDMNEFSVRFDSDNMKYVPQKDYDKYEINGTFRDYLDNKSPKDGNIVITHLKSGLSTTIHYSLSVISNSYNAPGEDCAYLLEFLKSDMGKNYYYFLNLKSGDLYVVKEPFKLDTDGRKGRDGHNGQNGVNGTNEYDWTDKEGKKHHSKGTCGSAGYNGENGENGQDGGNSFIFLERNCSDSALTVTYKGGTGGKGGSGGLGGTHGKGSSCSGYKALDGYRGSNGVDGKNGSVQFQSLTLDNLIEKKISENEPKRVYTYIIVNKSAKKMKKKDDTDDDSDIMDY